MAFLGPNGAGKTSTMTMILALILPVLFFWGFGLNNSYVHETAGHGNVSAAEMISIALYGAVAATATCSAMVSIERTAGCSRQLRVTPLSPAAYIVIKMLTSLVLAAATVAAVYLVAPSRTRRLCRRTCGSSPGCACGRDPCCSPPSACSPATCCPPRTSPRSSRSR